MAAAIALSRMGMESVIFEQARAFARVGAGINLTPNAVKVLDGLGMGARIRETAYRPVRRLSRQWDTGDVTSSLELGDAGEARYGAPQLTVHRADLLAAMEAELPKAGVQFGMAVSGFEVSGEAVSLKFSNGSSQDFDVIVGADGIHSVIREAMLGPQEPRFSGTVAFRSVIPADKLAGMDLSPSTKWWGPDPTSQIFTFLINAGKELFVFATAPEPLWTNESWSVRGSNEELMRACAGYHPEALEILSHCEVVLKTAMYVREPLQRWTTGSVTLLGDSCHPMLPFMAQGAAMGLEDAVVLGRCLGDTAGKHIQRALTQYERARKERADRIQSVSGRNEWLRSDANADWVYGYDAWSVPLPPQ